MSGMPMLAVQDRDVREDSAQGTRAYDGRGGEEQGEHGCHELVQADTGGSRQKRATAAQVH